MSKSNNIEMLLLYSFKEKFILDELSGEELKWHKRRNETIEDAFHRSIIDFIRRSYNGHNPIILESGILPTYEAYASSDYKYIRVSFRFEGFNWTTTNGLTRKIPTEDNNLSLPEIDNI